MAQRITQPQLYIMMLVVALHIPICALLMLVLDYGPPAGAWAIAIAGLNTLVLQACYVAWAGLQDQVWGRPCRAAFQVRPAHDPSSLDIRRNCTSITSTQLRLHSGFRRLQKIAGWMSIQHIDRPCQDLTRCQALAGLERICQAGVSSSAYGHG